MADVLLTDGRESGSETWRVECLARHLLALALEQRRSWLAAHEERHGPEAVLPLKAAMTLLHEQATGGSVVTGKTRPPPMGPSSASPVAGNSSPARKLAGGVGKSPLNSPKGSA